MAKKTLNQLYEKVSSSLENNKTYSYKELCKLLEETDYSASSKLSSRKKQIENWALCFSFQRKGTKFLKVQIFSPEDFSYNLLKKKYQNTNIYGLCALMDMCNKLTGENHLFISKSEIATALGFYNKDFQSARYGDTTLLTEIEDEALNRYGESYAFLKPYKSEIRTARENKEKVSATTSNSFKDYAQRKSRNISKQIDSLLVTLASESLFRIQPRLIGGFVSPNFKNQKRFDINSIYKNAAGYYYPYIRDDGKKQPILVPYDDRPLSTPETDAFMIIHDQVMEELGCRLWTDVYAQHKEFKYQKLIFEKIKKELGALFVYQAYEINFSPNLIKKEQSSCKDDDSLFNIESMTTTLLLTNAESKKADLENNKKRQEKEPDLIRYKLGNTVSEKGKQLKTINQKTSTYLINNFTKKFVDIDLNEYFPMGFNLEELQEYSDLIWPKIINNSKRKSDNYESVFHETQIFISNQKQLEIPEETFFLPTDTTEIDSEY